MGLPVSFPGPYDTSITINAQNNIAIAGDVHVSSGAVEGNSSVTFTGDGTKLAFTGEVKTQSATDITRS